MRKILTQSTRNRELLERTGPWLLGLCTGPRECSCFLSVAVRFASKQKRIEHMRRYLVTGGCGFIGSHLTSALLRSGSEVVVLDNLSSGRRDRLPAGTHVIVGDIRDASAVRLALAGCDGCFHLAAIASVQRCNDHWTSSHEVNLGGTVRLFEAAREEGGIPVVYASSAAVYGESRALPLSESAAPVPISSYGADKLGCELQARAGGRAFGLPTIGLRFFNVFGPGQDPHSPYSGVMSIFLDRLSRNRPVQIFGDGRQTRDFIHVDDVVGALMLALHAAAPSAPVLNVCSGRGASIAEVAEELFSLRSQKSDLMFEAPRPGDIRHSVGDPSHAAATIGFRARVGLREGLEALLHAETQLETLVG